MRLLSLGDHLPACHKVGVLFDTHIVEFARSRRVRSLDGEEGAKTVSEPRAFRFLFFGLFVLLIGSLITGLANIRYQEFAQLVRTRASSEISQTPNLSLQAEREGADVRVSWDRGAVTIAHAQAGVLGIRDGDSRQQDLELDAVQLRTGTVLYTPVSNNVQFRLDVSGPNGQKASEWILVLGAPRFVEPRGVVAKRTVARQPLTAALSPTPVRYAVQVGSFRYRANAERLCAKMEARYGPSRLVLHEGDPPLWRVLVGNEATIEGAGMLGGQIQADHRPSRTKLRLSALSAPVPTNEAIPATPVSSSDPGAVVPIAVSAGMSQLPGAEIQDVVARTKDVPPDLPPSRQNIREAKAGDGDFAPEQVVHQVLPEVSRKARDTIQGTVRVRVKVRADASGSVVAATLDSTGPSRYFAELALQASRHWKFSPAKLDGRDVSSEWVLRFEFVRTATRVFPVFVARQSW